MRSKSESASVLFDNSKQKARAEIDAHLDTLSAYDFQELVGALLEGMGYTTRFVSPPGPDGWPAPGSEDTELGVLMEPEVGHGETEVYAGVQA